MRIAKDPQAGIDFPDVQVAIRPAVSGGDAPVMSDGKVFYGNVATDTDMLVTPITGGVETSLVLRSAESPDSFTFHVEVPDGDRLAAPDQPQEAATVMRGDQPVAEISAPVATGADQEPLASSSEIQGNDLVLHFAHQNEDVAYPVIVDPTAEENFLYWHDRSIDYKGWAYYAGSARYGAGPGFFTGSCDNAYGAGLYSCAGAGNYGDGAEAHWSWRARGDAYIFRAEFGDVASRTVYPGTCFSQGVLNSAGTAFETGQWSDGGHGIAGPGPEPYQNCGDNTYFYRVHCLGNNPCSYLNSPQGTPVGSEGNYMFFQQYMAGTAHRNCCSEIYMGGAQIFEADLHAPYFQAVASGLPSGQGWVDSGSWTASLQATDGGLGLHKLALNVPGGSPDTRTYPCDGSTGSDLGPNQPGNNPDDRNNPCPTTATNGNQPSWLPSGNWTQTFPYNTTNMPEGDNTITATAVDYMGNSTDNTSNQRTWHVKVDRSAPSLNLSGDLFDFRTLPDDPTNIDLEDQDYPVHVDATDGTTDGTPAGARSGVRAIDVYVDQSSSPVQHVEQTCPQGSCPLATDWTFQGSQYQPGTHTIRAVATDQLNHSSEQSWTVTTADASTREAAPPLDSVVSDTRATDAPYDDLSGSGIDPVFDDNTATASSSPDTRPSAAPRAAPGYYVPNTKVKPAFNRGCDLGHAHHSGLAILDFGGPQGTDRTKLINGSRISIDAAVAATEAYGRGFYHCLSHARKGSIRISLAMGENNSTDGKRGASSNVSSASGAAWANAVDRTARYFKQKRIAPTVAAAGAMDFEPNFGLASSARAYARGFFGASPRPLYNFGSADGCPPKPPPSGQRRGGSCDNGWTQYDISSISDTRNGLATPEIYIPDQVPQWPAISLYGSQNRGRRKMFFPGPVTEYQRDRRTFPPSVGWSELFRALRARSKTSQNTMPYVTDFHRDAAWGR